MRRFVVDLLDFLCIALIIIATSIAFLSATFTPGGNILLGLLSAVVVFIAASVAMGAILALTEIAKNSRRIVTLMEEARSVRN
ncbi:hypothetical protein [Methylobacterium sp. Leaf93]|uniref:hypothetical protein n=1 Tax=Methylobacterium sp. Leaf93 TaxID=1736249 RepID=UPI0006FAF9AD|nr:hypothetical protein [Methylobacterium sp. Leaf93]KQP09327.1 hypothetical protein ASF26_04680 [Methylobacterium sp. Leaf93]